MLTQGKIDQFYTDVNSLKLKYPVAEIHRSTGFPKSNISEWLSKKKVPSENFIDIFYDKFKNEIHKSSTSVRDKHGHDIIAVDSKGTVMLIELKTASGKTVKVKPEGETEITLLNAFLEERDRVIHELQVDKEKLQNTIETNLSTLTYILASLSRHDRAFHETILKSLSRVEGGKVDLIAEARSYEAVMQAQEFLAGSKNEADMTGK